MASIIASDPVYGSPINPALPAPTSDGRLRFNRDAYHRLFEAGILPSDIRVELIDGEIYMMSPIGPSQGGFISRLMNFFVKQLPQSLDCRIQLPVVAGDHSEPEPDLAVVRRKDDDYRREHPTPDDVVLLVEVAQSSLRFDLGVKLRLYALCGIPEYWVIDIEHKAVLVHRDPSGGQYRALQRVVPGETVASLAAPDCRLDVTWLFH